MTTPDPASEARTLLDRTARMRALARRLVSDAAAADDLVQTALARAVETGAAPAGEAGAWYAAVLRNAARDRSRREGNRRARERAAARPEALPETLDAVANAERQRDVAQAVLDLDEPYRTVVLLRFFEDLPPRTIAKRTGRPVETVRKQVQRGLEHLRRSLEARYGDRGAWAVALLPLAGPGAVRASAGGVAVAGGGGSLGWMALALRAAVVAVVVTAVGVIAARATVEREDASSAGTNVPRIASLTPTGPDVPAEVAATETVRTAAAVERSRDGADATRVLAGSLPPPRAGSASSDGEPFRALVVGLDAQPIADVEFTWSPAKWADPATVRSDAEGALESDSIMPGRDAARRLEPVDERWHLLEAGVSAEGEVVVVLAPAVWLAGRAVGPRGAPIARAKIKAQHALDAVPEFDLDLSGATARGARSARTDEDGAFVLGFVPTHPVFRLTATRPGESAATRFSMPTHDAVPMELVLPERPGRDHPIVTGVVYESSGAVAPRVEVRFGQEEATTDEVGRFRLAVPHWPDGDLVTALAHDGRFATATPPDREAAMDANASVPLVLRLPDSMELLVGQVVDEDGTPVPGLEVHLVDGTRVGTMTKAFETWYSRRPFHETVETDGRGVFSLDVLADRPYWLRLLDRSTMLVHDVRGIRPGSELQRIVLPADRFVDRIEGTVVDVHGAPVEGAAVSLVAVVLQFSNGHRSEGGASVRTDDNGRFVLERAPWRGLQISVDARPNGRGGTERFPLGELAPTYPLRLRIERSVEVALQLAGEPAVDEIEVRDDGNEPLAIVEIRSGGTYHSDRLQRAQDGRFALFEVSQRAASLVLMTDGTEVRRVPVRLDPTERNVIDL
ncbi:MAG: sigma-70 family RNA polymerase sigma factor [Planctomycetota bacterium]